MTLDTTEITNGAESAPTWSGAAEASAATEIADPRTERGKPYRASYPLPLSDAEKLYAGAELANGMERVEALRAEKKAAAERVQEKIDAELERMASLAAELRSGKRDQEVDVYAETVFSLGVVRVRLVDSDVVIHERPMEPAERQRSLLSVVDSARPAATEPAPPVVHEVCDPVCPCQTEVEDPGPHIATCPYSDPNYEPPGGHFPDVAPDDDGDGDGEPFANLAADSAPEIDASTMPPELINLPDEDGAKKTRRGRKGA